MYEKPPYTPGMREVLKLSKAEASRLGNHEIGPEHYLLGIIRKGDGLAIQVLTNLDVDFDDLREQIERLCPKASHPIVGLLAPNLDAKKVLETVREIATEMRHGWIGSEHLLLGLIRNTSQVPSKVLRSYGIDFERAEREVLNVIDGSSGTSAIETRKARADAGEKGARTKVAEGDDDPAGLKSKVFYFVDHKGKRVAVCIPLEGRERAIEEFFQDWYGVTKIAERAGEKTISKDELLARLHKHDRPL